MPLQRAVLLAPAACTTRLRPLVLPPCTQRTDCRQGNLFDRTKRNDVVHLIYFVDNVIRVGKRDDELA